MGADCSKDRAVAVVEQEPPPPPLSHQSSRSAFPKEAKKRRKEVNGESSSPSLSHKADRPQSSTSRESSSSSSSKKGRSKNDNHKDKRNAAKSPRWDHNCSIQAQFKASNYNFANEKANVAIETASERTAAASGIPSGVVGFRNMGNTCYMNSSLQCLSMTIPLADYFLGEAHKGEINASNPLGSKGKLVQAFAKLIRDVWVDCPSSRVLRPSSFKSELESYSPQFKGRNQHDAQELLSILLDGIHEDLNRVKNKPYIEYKDCDGTKDADDAVEAWKNYLQRDKSVIVDIFQGQLRNRLKCMHCGHQNIRFEPIMYLSLPIADSCKSLDDCLRLFLKEERLTGDNQWYCSKCKKHRDATKKIDLWILPPILIVHFKRFRTNAYGLVASKNKAAVTFPLQDWMVGSYIKNKNGFAPRYDLYAVANHMGQMKSGHYTAYGLHRLDDQWYEFNDSVTRAIDPSEIEQNRSSAYVLFYNRVGDAESTSSNGSSERIAPLVRRQSVSRPDLWPHAQVTDNRYRSFSRSSQRSNSRSNVFTESPRVALASSRKLLSPQRNEILDEDHESPVTWIKTIPNL